MMFLQYAVLGAILPILSLYLRDNLGFNGRQTGMIMAMSAVAASVAPVIGSFVADKLLSTERLLSLSHLVGGALMLVLANQRGYWSVLGIYLFYMMAIQPTIGLTNAVAFHHLPGERSRFAGIRVWGTLGWMVVGAVFGYFWLGQDATGEQSGLRDALKLASALSFGMFAYCLTLPRVNPELRRRPSVVPTEAFAALRDPAILVVAFLHLLIFMALQHYYIGAGPYLRSMGFAEKHLMPALALGQLVEVFTMLALVFVLRKLRIKTVLSLGILSEIARFTLFAIDGSTWTALAGITCHGFSIAFFMTASLIFIDHRCSPAARSGVHQLFTIISFGMAVFVGSQLAGYSLDLFSSGDRSIDFRLYWAVPLVIVTVALVTLAALFPRAAGRGPAESPLAQQTPIARNG